MLQFEHKSIIKNYDERRNIAIPGNTEETLNFSVEHFIAMATEAIQSKGFFAVALSGGSTPKSIYQKLASDVFKNRIDWKKVLFFWSDERCVPPDHTDSNYKMAMDAGLSTLPIPSQNIFRMKGEGDPEEEALHYENAILTRIPNKRFDLVMLGIGEDGHTASLFPKTHGLHAEDRLVIANFIPEKNVWRLTLTFECINDSLHPTLYVLGKNKASIVNQILTGPYNPDVLPAQRIGTHSHKALWILDQHAASDLEK